MFNNGRFNVLGFNSGAVASLVIISATANLGTGSASTEFSESSVLRKAHASFNGNSQAIFSDGVLIQRGEGDWAGESEHFFDAVANYSGKIQWSGASIFDVKSEAQFWSTVDYTASASITAYTDLVFGEMSPMVATASWDAVANRGESAFVSWSFGANWLNNDEPWVNRQVIGDWAIDSHLWLNPVHDQQLGYLNHDSYWFPESNALWNNTPFLTAIFTTGGFIGGDMQALFKGTKIQFDVSQFEPVEAELEISSWQNHASTWSINTSLDTNLIALRIARDDFHEWETSSEFSGKCLIRRAGKLTLVSTPEFNLIGLMKAAGRTALEGSAQLDPVPVTKIRLARVRWDARGTNASSYDALRTAYTTISLDGIASSMIAAGVLRLVDAPSSRTFNVPFSYRRFEVPYKNNNKQFEVPS